MLDVLRKRYGSRLENLVPTPASELYLYGDRLSAPDRVQAARDALRGAGRRGD